MILCIPDTYIAFFEKKVFNVFVRCNISEVYIMAFTDFLKDIFMIKQETSFVGLSSFKSKKKVKKHIVKSVKNSEPKLSDLMRKDGKTMREKTFNI